MAEFIRNNGGSSWWPSVPNAPRGPELHQEAQSRSNLTFISEDVLLKAAPSRFRKQLFTVRDLGQDGGKRTEGAEREGGPWVGVGGAQRDRESRGEGDPRGTGRERQTGRQRERQRAMGRQSVDKERGREIEGETETNMGRQRGRDREIKRKGESQREREWEAEGERERQRETHRVCERGGDTKRQMGQEEREGGLVQRGRERRGGGQRHWDTDRVKGGH